MLAWFFIFLKYTTYFFIFRLSLFFILINILLALSFFNNNRRALLSEAFYPLANSVSLNFFYNYEKFLLLTFFRFYSYFVLLFFWFLYFKSSLFDVYLKFVFVSLILFFKLFYFFSYSSVKAMCIQMCVPRVAILFTPKFAISAFLLLLLALILFMYILYWQYAIVNILFILNFICVLNFMQNRFVYNLFHKLSFSHLDLLFIFNEEVVLLVTYNYCDDLNHFIGDYEDPFLLFWFGLIFDKHSTISEDDYVDFSFNDYEDNDIDFLNFWVKFPFEELLPYYDNPFIYEWTTFEVITFLLNKVFKFFY